jgi:UDP-N-acetylglucosamine 2-epimerase (non-hydrolysing)
MKKILTVFGTRPEAIKMCPLILELKKDKAFDSRVCVTAQHREMLDQVLNLYDVEPEYDLNVMTPKQTLSKLLSNMLDGLNKILSDFKPDLIIVHGDTATTLAASLSAYFNKVKLCHVEAGLRTGDLYSPWPEEGNRKLTSVITDIHFAPTSNSKLNLLNEGVSDNKIFVTGNTVIDSLIWVQNKILHDDGLRIALEEKFSYLNNKKKLILVTGHRRESFGKGFENICLALKQLAQTENSIEIIYPVHLNPNVQLPVDNYLSGIENIHLIKPLDYLPFCYLMNRSYIILTDSGGIQEEAPSLGKPVCVMRDNTERPEAIEAGTVRLVGTNVEKIIKNIRELLIDQNEYKKMSIAHNPYGDGESSKKIVKHLKELI